MLEQGVALRYTTLNKGEIIRHEKRILVFVTYAAVITGIPEFYGNTIHKSNCRVKDIPQVNGGTSSCEIYSKYIILLSLSFVRNIISFHRFYRGIPSSRRVGLLVKMG